MKTDLQTSTDASFHAALERDLEFRGGEAGRKKPSHRRKSEKAEVLEDFLWKKWPTHNLWPGILSVEEAAAYLRVSSDFIRDATQPDRSRRSKLRHQSLPGKGDKLTKRIHKADLDAFGLVEGS